MDRIRNANPSVKSYLKNEYQNLIENRNIAEGIESALPYGSGQESTDIILEIIQDISGIE